MSVKVKLLTIPNSTLKFENVERMQQQQKLPMIH